MAILTIEILEYWHAGSGEAGGADLDLVVTRDRLGLPVLPARSVKGLLRDAVRLGESFEHVPEGTAARVFGVPTSNEDPTQSEAGSLIFEDAIHRELRDWARQVGGGPESRVTLEGLFEVLARTAIDDSGTAKDGALHKVEATIPLTLSSRITPLPAHCEDDWKHLATCAPLIRNLGLGRRRGLGRCRCRLDNDEEEN